MRRVALFNSVSRVLPLASLVPLIAVAGDAKLHFLEPSPDTPAVIYAIPQSQALAIAREAIRSAAGRCGVAADEVRIGDVRLRGGGIGRSVRGYWATYRLDDTRFYLLRQLYILPAAGTAGSGQQIDGFRFEITNWIRSGSAAGPGAAWGADCEKALASSLQTALDATGTATTVTSLRLRPHGEGRAVP
jgi:hypothetical protein